MNRSRFLTLIAGGVKGDAIAFIKAVLARTFSSVDLWYGYAGVLVALIYLWEASV